MAATTLVHRAFGRTCRDRNLSRRLAWGLAPLRYSLVSVGAAVSPRFLPERPAMEFNRNQYFFMGVVLLLLGLQFNKVSSYTLTAEATRFLAERTQQSASDGALLALTTDLGAGPQKVLHPPDWLGWCLMSVAAVLILHSLAMRKPGAG